LTELGAVDPVVKATVTLSESGFVSVSDAIAYGEIKDDSLSGMYTSRLSEYANDSTGKLKGLFAASPSEDTTTETVTNQPPRESDSESDPDLAHTSSPSAGADSSSSSDATTPTPSPLAEVKKNIPKEQTIPLTVNTHFTSIRPMTLEEKKESRSR
jgi:hypoxia up-regulated 1